MMTCCRCWIQIFSPLHLIFNVKSRYSLKIQFPQPVKNYCISIHLQLLMLLASFNGVFTVPALSYLSNLLCLSLFLSCLGSCFPHSTVSPSPESVDVHRPSTTGCHHGPKISIQLSCNTCSSQYSAWFGKFCRDYCHCQPTICCE